MVLVYPYNSRWWNNYLVKYHNEPKNKYIRYTFTNTNTNNLILHQITYKKKHQPNTLFDRKLNSKCNNAQ